MQTIAISIFGNRVAGRLDCAEQLLLAVVQDGKIMKKEIVRLPHTNPIQKINDIIGLGVNAVICGGIPGTYLSKLEANQVRVISWIRGEVNEVLEKYLKGDLVPAYSQPAAAPAHAGSPQSNVGFDEERAR